MASTSQPVGQTVSHYRLLRRIGGGGMSILLILVVLTVVSVGSEAACPCAAAPCSAAEKALQIVYGQKIRDGIGRSHESRYALCDSHSCRGRIHHHASHASRRREHRHGERKRALGMGDRFSRGTLEPMEVGDFGFASKKMAHFGFSKTDTIIQVHGVGPFITQWVVPMYELTDEGVLLKISAGDAGHPAPTIPEGCFALKLGAPVRGSYGEGVVVAAQCTPGQLTQYRVERADGERFWTQRDELNTP